MKKYQQYMSELREIRNSQPQVTLQEAQRQAKRVMSAIPKIKRIEINNPSLETMQKINEALKEDRDSLQKELISLKEKWNPLLKACVDAEAEVESFKDKMEDLNLRNKDLEEKCFIYLEEINMNKVNNTNVLANREITISNLLKKVEFLESTQKNAEHLAKKVLILDREKNELIHKLNSSESNRTILSKLNSELERENSDLEIELDDSKKTCETLKEDISSLMKYKDKINLANQKFSDLVNMLTEALEKITSYSIFSFFKSKKRAIDILNQSKEYKKQHLL